MNLIHDFVYRNEKGKRIYPQIYIYSDKNNPSWVKVGYTTRKNPEDRVREQYSTLLQLDNEPYIMLHVTEAIRYNGVSFTDNDLHYLLSNYTKIPKRGEFYQVNDLYTISKLILDIKNDTSNFNGIRPTCKVSELPNNIHKSELPNNKQIIPKINTSSFKRVNFTKTR